MPESFAASGIGLMLHAGVVPFPVDNADDRRVANSKPLSEESVRPAGALQLPFLGHIRLRQPPSITQQWRQVLVALGRSLTDT